MSALEILAKKKKKRGWGLRSGTQVGKYSLETGCNE
jgi:hypothetical protein